MYHLNIVMFTVLTAVNMKIMVFQDVTPCNFREMYSTIDGSYASLFWPVFYLYLKVIFLKFWYLPTKLHGIAFYKSVILLFIVTLKHSYEL
jgi:hypothetical protein